MRRLLHVFSTFAVGGPQIRFCQLANALGRRHHHIVVAMDGDYACAERLDPGLAVTFPKPRLPRKDPLRNALALRRLLAELSPDVLLTYNWGAIEWGLAHCLLPVAPHVHVADGFGPEEAAGQLRRRVLTRRLVLRRAARVVMPSRLLETIARDQWRIPERLLAYLPNGIDCARFAAPPRPPRDTPVIGTVAALRPEKNLARLLDAFARLPGRPMLVIAGDGPERAHLERRAQSLGVAGRVGFLGHVARPETVLAGLDVFAASSDTEQMPYGIIEAMAAGLPVAATDVGDIAAMVAPDNRRFVGPRDARALAASLAELLAAPALRARLGQANRAKALAEFDLSRMVAAWDALFCEPVKADLQAQHPQRPARVL